jgi:hypothetical protein
MTVPDPILDEIWRVRQRLLKEHGGLEGFLNYVRKLDQANRRRKARRGVNSAAKKRTRQDG